MDNIVSFYDINNIEQVGQIDKIRNTLIDTKQLENSIWEISVNNILNGKKISKEIIEYVSKTERSKLKAKEKILYDYIVKHIE